MIERYAGRGLLAAFLGVSACSGGGGEAGLETAIETITEIDVRTRVNLIAADSMGGRDTPSRGLDLTATYIADEMERMGLESLGDAGTWFQTYPVRISTVDPTRTRAIVRGADGSTVSLAMGQDMSAYAVGAPAGNVVELGLVVVGGGDGAAEALDPASFEGKGILWAAPGAFDGDQRRRALATGTAVGAAFILVPVGDEASMSASRAGRETVSADFGRPFMVNVRERALGGSSTLLAALEAQRGSPGVSRSAAEWTITFETAFEEDRTVDVPNVIGMVRGGDLPDEYVIITAHFDHVGSRCAREGEVDRICNGADDNASGTTGLLELAEAFAHPDAQPRRSVIFGAVSGEERGLWGSQFLAENAPVPIENVVANINMDHLGRNWRDSIVVIGSEHSDLGPLAERVARDHPELRMTPLPDQWPDERIYFRSDHYNFAREGIPILFFTNGFHDDYHRVTDHPDKIDAEKQSRVVRYIFRVAAEIANQEERPRWDPDSYREIVRPERQAR